jgi:hypothetical protein
LFAERISQASVMLKSIIFLALCILHVNAFTLIPTTKSLAADSGFRKDFLVSSPSPNSVISTSLASSQGSLLERFGDRFDRWSFLQDILEGDAQNDLVNQVLFQVLEGALKFPRPKSDQSDEAGSPAGSPEMTAELKGKIENVLAAATGGRVPALGNPENSVIELLEELLPDPRDEEDASKSLWDIVMELHGNEMVKVNETNPTAEWKTACLVTRLLINFDFLMYGIVTVPFV